MRRVKREATVGELGCLTLDTVKWVSPLLEATNLETRKRELSTFVGRISGASGRRPCSEQPPYYPAH